MPLTLSRWFLLGSAHPARLAVFLVGMRRALSGLRSGDRRPPKETAASDERFSPLTGIRPDNVASLEVVWTYRTGDAYIDPVIALRSE